VKAIKDPDDVRFFKPASFWTRMEALHGRAAMASKKGQFCIGTVGRSELDLSQRRSGPQNAPAISISEEDQASCHPRPANAPV
jgi:hypothetical protein